MKSYFSFISLAFPPAPFFLFVYSFKFKHEFDLLEISKVRMFVRYMSHCDINKHNFGLWMSNCLVMPLLDWFCSFKGRPEGNVLRMYLYLFHRCLLSTSLGQLYKHIVWAAFPRLVLDYLPDLLLFIPFFHSATSLLSSDSLPKWSHPFPGLYYPLDADDCLSYTSRPDLSLVLDLQF